MHLTAKEFSATAEFMKSEARPLEAALFAFEFEKGRAETAIYALANYQNMDGGFGKALEPDMRLPGSSVIATTQAFPHFRTLGLSGEHPMVADACRYLMMQYVSDEKRWRIMPTNVDDAPHAPWWEVGGELWNSRVNPTAEILGYMYEYPAKFDAAVRDMLAQQVVSWVDAQDYTMEMHDLLCLVALVENPAAPEPVKSRLLAKLKMVADKTIERSPEQWLNYSIPPLGIISTPQSLFASQFEHDLPENLKYMLKARGEDGVWHPNWQWGDAKLWAQVEKEWTGVLTLNNLKKLRAFEMITGVKA